MSDLPGTDPLKDSGPSTNTVPEYVHRALERKLLAEAVAAEAEARESVARAEEQEIDARKALRSEREIEASDFRNFIYRFQTPVSPVSVDNAQRTLAAWSRMYPGQEFTIIFTSPGGDVVAGLAFWDFLTTLKANGHRLICHTEGMAASMAGILLQAGDVRKIGKESYVLIHQVQAGMIGSWGELEDRMAWLEKIQQRILDIFATRASAKTGKPFKSVRKNFENNWQRKDWWIDSKEALELGIVDEIVG